MQKEKGVKTRSWNFVLNLYPSQIDAKSSGSCCSSFSPCSPSVLVSLESLISDSKIGQKSREFMVSLQVAVTYSPASVSVENQNPSLGQEVMKHLRCLIWVKICQRENQSGLVFLFSPTLPSLLMSSSQYHGALGDNACLPPPDVGQECSLPLTRVPCCFPLVWMVVS